MEKLIINSNKIFIFAAILFMLGLISNAVFAEVEIGAFVGNEDHRAPYDYEVQNFENLSGRHLNSVLVYWAWNDGDFPATNLYNGVRYHDSYDTKTVLQLAWEPWSRYGANDSSYSLTDIIGGVHDDYITEFAQDCRSWQEPIRLRFAHEMIQDNNPGTPGWYPWQDRPLEYKQAWEHVYQIFKNVGANNVEFVWAPNNYPGDLNTISQYYPGQDKVDWLGMDGYNAGEDGQPGWPYWQNFDELFYGLYHVMVDHPEVFGDKRVMLAEFASAENGGNKAEWIRQAFTAIQYLYPEIDAFYWFNVMKEADWRINSSPESLLAFQTAMQNSYYTSHVIPEPNTILLFGAGFGYLITCLKKNKIKERG